MSLGAGAPRASMAAQARPSQARPRFAHSFWGAAAVLAASLRSGSAVVLRGGIDRNTSAADVAAWSLVAGNASQLRAASNTSLNTSANASSYPRGPRVYFLFLAVDKVSNLDVWQQFFAHAPSDRYRAYIHCKEEVCKSQVAGSALQVVPTVPSYYCTDLVSPMQQLVNIALQDGDGFPHEADKFAFVSDSTLPAKPFYIIYNTLTSRQGSDFCIFPSTEWADVPTPGGGIDVAVKHHQWITLERAHAQRSWDLWKTGYWHHFMAHFRMNQDHNAWSYHGFGDSHNFGCLDEFWYMLALYGPLHHPGANYAQDMNLQAFAGGPLRISAGTGWQGECDTFVLWSKYLNQPGKNPFNMMYTTLDQMSVPHGGNFARPGWWDTITTHGLRSIRQSSFLFVRKFIDRPRLYDSPDFVATFTELVLSN